jgi:hypothetical protein
VAFLVFLPQLVKLRLEKVKRNPPNGGACPLLFVYSQHQQIPNNLRKGKKMIETKTPKKVGCLVCGFRSENVIEIEEFQDNGCPNCEENKTMNQEERNELHNAMMEDFSDVIAKYFPNFDNNIEDQTWSFLVLFTEETIQQLGKATK